MRPICHLMKIIATLFVLMLSPSLLAEFRVVSYNIRHGVGMDKKLNLERTAKVLKDLSPDIVALQEVDQVCERSVKIDQAAFLAESLGDFHHRFGSFMDYQGGKYGLAILSKYPIVVSRVHRLPDGAEPRVALEVEVDLPQEDGTKKRISVVCVHFDFERIDTARFAQAQHLITQLAERSHPVIVTGDFNDVRESRTLNAFAKDFTLPEGDGPTTSSVKPGLEIDFCVYRGPLATPTVKVIKGIRASDHLPLLSVFSKFESKK